MRISNITTSAQDFKLYILVGDNLTVTPTIPGEKFYIPQPLLCLLELV